MGLKWLVKISGGAGGAGGWTSIFIGNDNANDNER